MGVVGNHRGVHQLDGSVLVSSHLISYLVYPHYVTECYLHSSDVTVKYGQNIQTVQLVLLSVLSVLSMPSKAACFTFP